MKISSDSKHVEANTAGHEDDSGEQSGRWLISYADLITTLMVLFLALYVLQLSRNKELESRLFEQQRTAAVAARAPEIAALERADGKQQLLSLLEPLREKRQITISSVPHGVEIAINAKVLFNTGDAHLLPESSDVLAQVATILRLHSTNNILVEGHTDSVPISTAKYESNWELSSARAGAVVRYFADKGIAAHRLAAIGRADNFPLIIGDDAAARAANRRVTILVEG